VASGSFYKLGSSRLFGPSWKRRSWLLGQDGQLSYSEPTGALKGSVDVRGVQVRERRLADAAEAVKHVANVALALTLVWPEGNKELELVFESVEDASTLILGLATLQNTCGTASASAKAFASSKGLQVAPEGRSRPAATETAATATAAPASSATSPGTGASAGKGDENCLDAGMAPKQVNSTSSLGRVASLCWVGLCVYSAVRPTPMILFLFSIFTGFLVEVLRWGDENQQPATPHHLGQKSKCD